MAFLNKGLARCCQTLHASRLLGGICFDPTGAQNACIGLDLAAGDLFGCTS